jgi:hypothetical protein
MKIGPLQAESETKGVTGFMTSRGSLCSGAAPQAYDSWVVCCMKGVALMDEWNGDVAFLNSCSESYACFASSPRRHCDVSLTSQLRASANMIVIKTVVCLDKCKECPELRKTALACGGARCGVVRKKWLLSV